MIELHFGPEGLSGLMTISPLAETVRSLRALHDPGSYAIRLPWATATRKAVVISTFAPSRHCCNRTTRTRRTSSALPGGPPGPHRRRARNGAHRSARARPRGAPHGVRAHAAAGRACAAGRSAWTGPPRPRRSDPRVLGPGARTALAAPAALLTATSPTRGRTLADGGAKALFSSIDPSFDWTGETLRLDKVFHGSLRLDDRGLLLIPSAFVWPRVVALLDPAWQPGLLYPARGVSELWAPSAQSGHGGLSKLIGRRRAALLAMLDQPTSTTDLARSLDASAGGVSQHLSVLRASGLVRTNRVGRSVLYLRTALGDSVLDAESSRPRHLDPSLGGPTRTTVGERGAVSRNSPAASDYGSEGREVRILSGALSKVPLAGACSDEVMWLAGRCGWAVAEGKDLAREDR